MIPTIIKSFLRPTRPIGLRDAHQKRVATKLAAQQKRVAAQPETRPNWIMLRKEASRPAKSVQNAVI